jgi:NAD(P)-dependent dehydrogenase (short-subunit alcohol dehydrogenase family)
LVLTPGAELSLSEKYKALFLKHNSLSYLGCPEHIAGTVAFLASEDAGYINGQTIIADGGMTCHNPSVGDLLEM